MCRLQIVCILPPHIAVCICTDLLMFFEPIHWIFDMHRFSTFPICVINSKGVGFFFETDKNSTKNKGELVHFGILLLLLWSLTRTDSVLTHHLVWPREVFSALHHVVCAHLASLFVSVLSKETKSIISFYVSQGHPRTRNRHRKTYSLWVKHTGNRLLIR